MPNFFRINKGKYGKNRTKTGIGIPLFRRNMSGATPFEEGRKDYRLFDGLCTEAGFGSKKGYLFGFCTGRPIYGVLDYLNHKVKADFYITNSGATIHDKDLNLIFEKIISNKNAKEIRKLNS